MTSHSRTCEAQIFCAAFALAVAGLLAGCGIARQTQDAQVPTSSQPPAGEKERVLAQQQYSAGDHASALSSLLESARAGNVKAQEALVSTFESKCWRIGVHQAEDFIYAYQAAAQRDETFGLTVMGLMREFGFSPASVDSNVASGYYARAAAQGSSIAKARLEWLNQKTSRTPTASALSRPAPCMR